MGSASDTPTEAGAPTPEHKPADEGTSTSTNTNVPPSGATTFDAKKFIIITGVFGLAVALVIMLNQLYLLGSTFDQTNRSHSYKIAVVNYDSQDTVSGVFADAYAAVSGPQFPTLVFLNQSAYPDPQQLVDAVRQQHYWAAIYFPAGASARLAAAVTGRASSYDGTQALTYVWNEIRYAAISLSVIQASIIELQSIAQSIYQVGAAQAFMASANQTYREVAVSAYVTPFNASQINLAPAPQAGRAFYNTVFQALPIIEQNMFLIAFGAMAGRAGFFRRGFRFCGPWTLITGLVFTLFTSMLTTAAIWAFREGWAASGPQFATTWMVFWLVQHIYYQLIDGTLALFPIQVYSFILLTFIFINVAAVVFPMESSPGFYRWGQSLPAFEVLQLLYDVWSSSSARLYQSLPVLFAWWVVSATYAIFGTMERCKKAAKEAKLEGGENGNYAQASAGMAT